MSSALVFDLCSQCQLCIVSALGTPSDQDYFVLTAYFTILFSLGVYFKCGYSQIPRGDKCEIISGEAKLRDEEKVIASSEKNNSDISFYVCQLGVLPRPILDLLTQTDIKRGWVAKSYS